MKKNCKEKRSSFHKSGFGAIAAPLDWTGSGMDIAVGALAGMAGALGVKWVANKFLAGKLPPIVMKYFPLVGTSIAAAGLYFGQKKSYRAKGHAIGAITAGIAVTGWDVLRAQFPALAEVVSYNYSNYGLLQNDYAPSINGLIVDDTSGPRLNELAAMSMGGDDELDDDAEIEALMGM